MKLAVALTDLNFLGISRNVNEASVLFAPSLGCDECSYLSRGGLSMNTGWCVQIFSRDFKVRRSLSKVDMSIKNCPRR